METLPEQANAAGAPDRRDFLCSMHLMLAGGAMAWLAPRAAGGEGGTVANDGRLAVVWTSGDRDVALKMVFMYTFNAKRQGWFEEVTLVVWGPSAQLLAVDTELQEYLQRMREAGVVLRACSACADMYGVSDRLRQLGISVEGMGPPLTRMLKEGWRVLSF